MADHSDLAGDSQDPWVVLESQVVSCRKCPRLVDWRERVALQRRPLYRDWDYWGKPVPGFGDQRARVLVVGLAPGAHGSNRTGRMFTGDSSGVFLYRALFNAGFASQPESLDRSDGMELVELYISAVCRCAPPQNKPLPQEIRDCLPFLQQEIDLLSGLEGIVCLGRIAFHNTLSLYRRWGQDIPPLDFSHGAFYSLGEGLPWLLASYHPSRQNTQTGRLTEPMFDEIWGKVRSLLQ